MAQYLSNPESREIVIETLKMWLTDPASCNNPTVQVCLSALSVCRGWGSGWVGGWGLVPFAPSLFLCESGVAEVMSLLWLLSL